MLSNLGLSSLRKGQSNRLDTRTKSGFVVVIPIVLLNRGGEIANVIRRHRFRVGIE